MEAYYDERLIRVKAKVCYVPLFQSNNAFSAVVSGAPDLAVTLCILMPAWLSARKNKVASPVHLTIC